MPSYHIIDIQDRTLVCINQHEDIKLNIDAYQYSLHAFKRYTPIMIKTLDLTDVNFQYISYEKTSSLLAFAKYPHQFTKPLYANSENDILSLTSLCMNVRPFFIQRGFDHFQEIFRNTMLRGYAIQYVKKNLTNIQFQDYEQHIQAIIERECRKMDDQRCWLLSDILSYFHADINIEHARQDYLTSWLKTQTVLTDREISAFVLETRKFYQGVIADNI